RIRLPVTSRSDYEQAGDPGRYFWFSCNTQLAALVVAVVGRLAIPFTSKVGIPRISPRRYFAQTAQRLRTCDGRLPAQLVCAAVHRTSPDSVWRGLGGGFGVRNCPQTSAGIPGCRLATDRLQRLARSQCQSFQTDRTGAAGQT